MTISARKGLFVLLAFALVMVFALASAAPAHASHSWNGYHWARTSNPFTLKLGDNVSSAWDATLATASSNWNAPSATSTVLHTTVVAGASKRNCQPTKGRVEVCSKTYGKNGWLGLAQIWVYSDGHIAQGAVKLNDTYFNTSKYNNPNEKLHVMCQEIGHTFGLDHQSTDGSSLDTCMDYFSNIGANAGSASSTKPNQHDFDELALIYAHLDGTTTVAPFTNTGGRGKSAVGVGQDTNIDDQRAWGKEVRKDARGRESLYERDLGNGEKLFTFVTW